MALFHIFVPAPAISCGRHSVLTLFVRVCVLVRDHILEVCEHDVL